MSISVVDAERAKDDLADVLARYAELVRAEMHTAVRGLPALETFHGMIAYHLGWVDRQLRPQPVRAGKNLRPGFCLLLAEGLGGDQRDCVPLAAGIELIHNFSLVHDDIQDRSPTRRGRPTVWSIWGEAQAINVGDGLFAIAHQVWLRSPLAERDPSGFIEVMRGLEETIVRLCEGQFLDMSGEGNLDLSSTAYLGMIERKTAALIAEAAWVGARCATSDRAVLEDARQFGRELGLAFQIRDDLLGIWGDERETGKSASSDIAARKMTLPIILALEAGTPEQRDALRARYGAAHQEADDRRIRALLEATEADQLAAARERTHWDAAMAALERLPLEPAWREYLRIFARSFVERTA